MTLASLSLDRTAAGSGLMSRASGREARCGYMRILLIEDDRRVANFVARGLRIEGYETEVAFDAGQGIARAIGELFDLLLVDVVLPDVNGVELCRQLRGRGLWVPIIMLTGRDSVADRIRGFEAGADDYVTKPFAFEELLARMKALLNRACDSAHNRAINVGDVWLDPSTHEVRRSGKTVNLTPTEFGLLECLMRASGRVVKRATLEQQVLGHHQEVAANVLDVYMGRLRKKLRFNGGPSPIHTVRGVGYQLKG